MVQEGERKWFMSAIVVAVLLLGLVILLAFKQMSDGMWTAWCASVAGTGGAYAVANVVTKKIVEPKKGKK